MEHRKVEFEGNPIRVVNDNGMEYVCLMDVVTCLGLKWANENQRARDKFDVTNCVLPVLNSHKMSVTSVISFGNLESYLHSFKDRHGGFKPPKGFYLVLKRMISDLPDIIFDSQPDMIGTSPNTVNGQETVEENVDEYLNKIEPDADPIDKDEHFDEIQAIADEMKQEILIEEAEKQRADSESMDPYGTLKEQEKNEFEQEEDGFRQKVVDIKQDGSPDKEPEEVQATSYTAFPLSDGFKQNIDNMIDSTDLFIDTLTEFKSSLEELRNSQFVMLKNPK